MNVLTGGKSCKTKLSPLLLNAILNEMNAESIENSAITIIRFLSRSKYYKISFQIFSGYKVKEAHKKQLVPMCKEYLTKLTGKKATSDIVEELVAKIREVWLRLDSSAAEKHPELFVDQSKSETSRPNR